MPEIPDKPQKVTLYTCEIDRGGPKMHPCHKAHDALGEAGVDYETVVADRNRPFGLGSKGTRPEIKRISGQEKLPVLQMPDGSTIHGGGTIAKWAKRQGA